MSDLKPLGSERLQGDDKLKRIMEIANYGRTPVQSINESPNAQYIKESTNGVYGIVKEKDGYFVKKGLTESSLDYIGGIFMKNKNKFSSYAEALKRLELISGQESLTEAKKYVLKSKSSAPMSDAPVEDIPAEPATDMPMDDAPIDDLPPSDSAIEDIPAEEPEMGSEDASKRSDYMSEVQKFSGKLGQALRDVKERMESDDIKYVINMVLSAVDLDALDEEDKEEIAERFEPKDGESFDEPSMGDDMGDLPSDEFEDDGVDSEIDEIMAKLESFITAPAEEEISEKSIEDYGITQENEISEEEEIGEIDLDELKNEINKHVDETLSKYFK
jgi:hypothetical protein